MRREGFRRGRTGSAMDQIEMTLHPSGVLVVVLRGDLDLVDRDVLAESLDLLPTRWSPAIVLDLAAVTFLDCTALNVLLALARRCARASVGVLFAAVHGPPGRVIRTLRLDQVVTLVPDVEEALLLAGMWEGGPPEVPLSPLLGTVGRIPRPTEERHGDH